MIAVFVLAAFAWAPSAGMTGDNSDHYSVSEQDCVSAPTPECLIELAIQVARTEDSPATLLQEIAEEFLRKGERDQAKQLLGEAVRMGFDGFSTNTGFFANSDLGTIILIGKFLSVLKEYGFRELELEALLLLEEFVEQNPNSTDRDAALYKLFSAYLEQEDFDKAHSAVSRISDPVSRWEEYGDIAVAHTEAGRVSEALDTLKKIANARYRGKAKARIAAALAEKGEIEKAANMLSNVSSDIATTKAHIAITTALIAKADYDAAVAYANAISGTFQRAYVQDNTAGALAKAGLFESAIELAENIVVRQQRAQAIATVGQILASRGEIEAARRILAAMPRWAFYQDPADEGVDEARARLARGLLTAMYRENRNDEASLILLDAEEWLPYEGFHLKLHAAKTHAMNGQEAEAVELLKELEDIALSIMDPHTRQVFQSSIGSVYITIGQFEQAGSILLRIDEMYSGSDVQSGVFALVDAGEIEAAMQWMSFLETEGLKRPAFLHLVQHLGRTGKPQEALTLIESTFDTSSFKVRAWIFLATVIAE